MEKNKDKRDRAWQRLQGLGDMGDGNLFPATALLSLMITRAVAGIGHTWNVKTDVEPYLPPSCLSTHSKFVIEPVSEEGVR